MNLHNVSALNFVPDAETVLSWGSDGVADDLADYFSQCDCEIIVSNVVSKKLSSANGGTKKILREASEKPVPSPEIQTAAARHFALGDSQVAALLIAEDLALEPGRVYCVSDSDDAESACNRKGIEHLSSVGVGAFLLDEGVVDFEAANELMQDMKNAGMPLPPNYTALLRKEAGTVV